MTRCETSSGSLRVWQKRVCVFSSLKFIFGANTNSPLIYESIELGVRKGDRVLIYMPSIPEAIFGMLACARIGAVHSVVFGGFAAHELVKRIDDARPKVILSASCGLEGSKVIMYKPMLDEALRTSTYYNELLKTSPSGKQHPLTCVILQRDKAPAPLSSFIQVFLLSVLLCLCVRVWEALDTRARFTSLQFGTAFPVWHGRACVARAFSLCFHWCTCTPTQCNPTLTQQHIPQDLEKKHDKNNNTTLQHSLLGPRRDVGGVYGRPYARLVVWCDQVLFRRDLYVDSALLRAPVQRAQRRSL